MILRDGQLARFWHPTKGGWYVGQIVKIGRKWIVLQYTPNTKRLRIPRDNVTELPQ